MSISANSSIISIQDLPNLPGLRRNAASQNPRVFKDFLPPKASSSLLESSKSVVSYFDDPEYFNALSVTLNPYPSQAESFNDISGRYSIHSQLQDRKANKRPVPFSSTTSAASLATSLGNKEPTCVFGCYFWETVPENLREQKRVRYVDIVVYTMSNAIEIMEAVVPNSGLLQGKLLRKHQIPKPTGAGEVVGSNGYYTLHDFYAGAILSIYGKEYTVANCNTFARRFLMEELGIVFGPPKELPSLSDFRSNLRPLTNSTLEGSFSSTARPYTAASKSFYENDKLVLRFYGYWRSNENPPMNYAVRVHYFLADDSIEIISEYGRNDGRDRIPKFLSKMRVLKPSVTPALTAGSCTMEPVYSSDMYYTYKDIRVGGSIRVVGNDIHITDADDFTRNYYYNHQNVSLDDPIVVELESKAKRVPVTIPPHNGFGSEEDSLQTCSGSLMPKAPKKDGLKAKLYACVILRYKVKFTKPKPTDRGREFILQVYLEDDTIQIREIPARNSGFSGGKFLARSKQFHEDGQLIIPSHVNIGKVLRIQSFEFYIENADEFTLKYMEQNPEIWPQSSLDDIANKLKTKENELRDVLLILKERALEEVSYNEITELLVKVGINLSLQEKSTLFRKIDKKKRGTAKFFRIFKLLKDEAMFLSWSEREERSVS